MCIRDRGYSRPDLYAVQNWVVTMQGQMIGGATEGFTNNYQEIMAGTYKMELTAGTDAQLLMEALGDIEMCIRDRCWTV